MNIGLFGIDFPHTKGEFCIRRASAYYTVCSFDTDYLYEKDGVLVEGSKGDLLIMEPGYIVYHGPRKGAKEGFVNDWIQIWGEDFTQLLNAYPLPRNTAFRIGKSYSLRPYLEQLQAEYRCPTDGRKEMIGSILTQMLISLYRAYRHHHSQPADRSVQVVADAVAQDPGHNWHLSEMAAMSGYSVSRFSELFREQYRLSPTQYVLHHRIHLAKQYLLSGQASVSYIAEVCGFQSANYFCKYFKQAAGCPPSRYHACHDTGVDSPDSTVERKDLHG